MNQVHGVHMKTGLFSIVLAFNLVVLSEASFSKENVKPQKNVSKTIVQKTKEAPTISFEEGMNEAAKIYLPMQEELAKDSFKSFIEFAPKLRKLIERFDMSGVKGDHAKHYAGIPGKIILESQNLEKAKDLKQARESFKLLSQAFAMWVSMDKPKHLQVVYCPMAKASWIQSAGTVVANPYLTNMPRCGTVLGKEKKEESHHKHKH